MSLSNKKQLSPDGQADYLKEYWLYCIVFLIAVCGAIMFLLTKEPRAIMAAAFAVVGLIAALAGGTRLMLPLYFATTFGTVLTLPMLPGFLSLNRLIAMGLFLAIVLEFPRKEFRLFLSFPLAVFLLFQAYYLPMAFLKKPPEGTLPWESFFYLLVTIVIALRYWEDKWLKALTWGFVIASFFLIIVPGMAELILGADITLQGIRGSLRRVNGISVNAIVFAYYALWTIPLAAVLMVESRSPLARMALGVLILLLVFVSLMTLNRQTPIALFALVVVFIFFLKSRWRIYLTVMIVLVTIAAIPIAGAAILERFQRVHSVTADPSFAVRHDKLLIAIEMIKENFWTGIGHNYFRVTWNDYRPMGSLVFMQFVSQTEQYVDLGYVQIMTEYGAIGAFIALVLFIGTGVTIWKYYRISLRFENTWHTNFMAALAALFVHLLLALFIQDAFATPRTYIFYGMLGALCYSIHLKSKNLELEAEPSAP